MDERCVVPAAVKKILYEMFEESRYNSIFLTSFRNGHFTVSGNQLARLCCASQQHINVIQEKTGAPVSAPTENYPTAGDMIGGAVFSRGGIVTEAGISAAQHSPISCNEAAHGRDISPLNLPTSLKQNGSRSSLSPATPGSSAKDSRSSPQHQVGGSAVKSRSGACPPQHIQKNASVLAESAEPSTVELPFVVHPLPDFDGELGDTVFEEPVSYTQEKLSKQRNKLLDKKVHSRPTKRIRRSLNPNELTGPLRSDVNQACSTGRLRRIALTSAPLAEIRDGIPVELMSKMQTMYGTGAKTLGYQMTGVVMGKTLVDDISGTELVPASTQAAFPRPLAQMPTKGSQKALVNLKITADRVIKYQRAFYTTDPAKTHFFREDYSPGIGQLLMEFRSFLYASKTSRGGRAQAKQYLVDRLTGYTYTRETLDKYLGIHYDEAKSQGLFE